MSQVKLKFKEEQDQPRIKELCQMPKDKRNPQPRSRSKKRKIPPTPHSKETKKDHKRHYTEHQADRKMAEPVAKPEGSKSNGGECGAISELDKTVVKATELLLKPIRDDIKDLCNELSQDIADCHKLCEENRLLHQRIQRVETKNTELTKRLCDLENKMLESNVILHSIQESSWETKSVRQKKIFLVISETLIGRTLDE